MGTHPIFESDFDCLTDMLQFGTRRLLPLSKRFGGHYAGADHPLILAKHKNVVRVHRVLVVIAPFLYFWYENGAYKRGIKNGVFQPDQYYRAHQEANEAKGIEAKDIILPVPGSAAAKLSAGFIDEYRVDAQHKDSP